MSSILKNAKPLLSLIRPLLGKRNYQVLLVLVFIVTFFLGKELTAVPKADEPSSPDVSAAGDQPVDALVVRVVDGDTFEIEGGERVRLIGIDTPETVKPNVSVECFGKQSSERLKHLIEGKMVRLERDRTDRDRYARLLRYAYLGDVLINEALVREGYAESVAYKPDTAKQALLDRAEEAARDEKIGRWNPNVCSE